MILPSTQSSYSLAALVAPLSARLPRSTNLHRICITIIFISTYIHKRRVASISQVDSTLVSTSVPGFVFTNENTHTHTHARVLSLARRSVSNFVFNAARSRTNRTSAHSAAPKIIGDRDLRCITGTRRTVAVGVMQRERARARGRNFRERISKRKGKTASKPTSERKRVGIGGGVVEPSLSLALSLSLSLPPPPLSLPPLSSLPLSLSLAKSSPVANQGVHAQ